MTSISVTAAPAPPAPPAAVRRRRRVTGRIWLLPVALIFAYLYACMFLGGPFIAFDHENYINFLDAPYPFFFEPGYTAVAYAINVLFPDEARFPAAFTFFTLPPLLLVLREGARERDGRALMVFGCVLVKAFYIGYITQRFFFAELWAAALVIQRGPDERRLSWRLLLPGMIHFSALTIVPGLLWLRSRFSVGKTALGCAVLFAFWFYVRVVSGFQLFGYDYSRYLDQEGAGGFPFFTVIEMVALAAICWLVVPRGKSANYVAFAGLLLLLKIIFGDIEVFSRIFQIEIDLLMVMAGLHARRRRALLFLFGLGFFVLQAAFTSTAAEMIVYHATAVANVLRAL